MDEFRANSTYEINFKLHLHSQRETVHSCYARVSVRLVHVPLHLLNLTLTQILRVHVCSFNPFWTNSLLRRFCTYCANYNNGPFRRRLKSGNEPKSNIAKQARSQDLAVPRQFVYGHFVYGTSSTDISSRDISSTVTVNQRL